MKVECIPGIDRTSFVQHIHMRNRSRNVCWPHKIPCDTYCIIYYRNEFNSRRRASSGRPSPFSSHDSSVSYYITRTVFLLFDATAIGTAYGWVPLWGQCIPSPKRKKTHNRMRFAISNVGLVGVEHAVSALPSLHTELKDYINAQHHFGCGIFCASTISC